MTPMSLSREIREFLKAKVAAGEISKEAFAAWKIMQNRVAEPRKNQAVRGLRVVPVASNRVQILIGEDESTVIDIMEIHGGYGANIDIYTAAQMETLNPPQHTVQVDQHGRLHVFSEEPDA